VDGLALALGQGLDFYLYDRLRWAHDQTQFLQWCPTDAVQVMAPWREEGVYLITGGAGGLGRIFASDIIRSSAQARVVLVGRTQLAEFERLRLSPRVEYRFADVARQEDVAELMMWIKEKFGRLDGVIHAAGILRDKLLSGKTALELHDVLAAKVQGTVNLDLASRELHPELFILCSSCASLRGNPGQADYATANGFMDAYAEVRRQEAELAGRSEFWLSLNWPLWGDGGMTMAAARQDTLSRDTGMVAMPSAAGLESLYTSIALARTRSTHARIMVLHGVMKQLLPLFVSEPVPRLDVVRNNRAFALRSELRRVIHDALLISKDAELDDRATFLDLGIDSIQMVRFMASLSRRLGVELAQTLLFEYPTIGTLTDYLFTLKTPSQVLAETAAAKTLLKSPTNSDALSQTVAKHPELVLFNHEADGPLLFCIYPMSGDVGMYAKLAQASQNRYRVLGIKARGLLSDFTPLTTVKAMAEHCARLIAEIQPQGDLYILGTSMGGAVAYETAAELQRQLRKVSQLIFLEAPLIASAQQQALWSTEPDSNLLMNANFLLITMLHLDPAFREQKDAGDVRWEDWLIQESDIAGFSVLSSEELLVERLVQCVCARGVKQAPAVLAQRLRSMASIHLANLQAFRLYRAKPLPAPEELSVVMLRTKTATAISQDVYNPDYLLNVQHFHDGLSVLLDNWFEVIPSLDVRIVEGENHFELLNTAQAVAQVSDLVGELLYPSQARAATKEGPAAAGQARPTGDAIAVIGMSGRFPGADSLDALWELLRQGKTAFSPLPTDRGWSELWQSGEQINGTAYGGFLTEIDQFDSGYFQMPPKEAQSLDPAERIFLEECWRAIRQAGLDPTSLSNANWGVFCGAGGDYTMLIERLSGLSPHVTTSSIAARISYSFGLTGPCVSVDAGCASSLQAIAQACDQLLLGHCEVAIAGGAYVHSTPNLLQAAAASDLLSCAGHACVLGIDAQGMLPAEGAGVVVLKPLSKALADGDTIQGVIEAWGMNHSGRTNGLSAPSAKAQRALFAALLQRHNIDPASISMIEANANGTPLGDRLEIEALQNVYGQARVGASPCAVGSIEGNIGHPFHASGVAHVLKVLLSLRAQQFAPTVGVGMAHPGLTNGNLRLIQTLESWTAPKGLPRRAVVNSFGATGTNVQLILRESESSQLGSTVQPSALSPEVPFKRRRCWFEATRVVHPDPVASPSLAPLTSIPTLIEGFIREITGYGQGEISFAKPLSHYGVDSLIVMRLLAKLNQYFSLELQLADLAVLESIDGLATIVEALVEARSAKAPRVVRPVHGSQTKNVTDKWLLERLS
jgi:3-oxoacyl-(acyl-carrier-protein) synthase/thioesterase domain-containing protein/acyl carrier protein